MAGFFDPDQPGGSMFNIQDPNSMMLMGALAGLGQAGAASRMPITPAQVWGGLGGGLLAGQQASQRAQLTQQETGGEALKNMMALEGLRQQAAVMGQPIPTMNDIRTGKYQGLAPLFAKMYADQQNKLQTPQMPTPTGSAPIQQSSLQAGDTGDMVFPPYASGSLAAKNIANNNPGNMKTASGGFMSFPDMQSGVNAIGGWLDRAQNVHGLQTIRQLIDDPTHGYAPSADPGNKGKALPEVAANYVGIGPDDPINMGDPLMKEKMTRAILRQEQGGDSIASSRPPMQLAQNVAQPQQAQPDTSTPFERLQSVMFDRAQRSVAGLPITPTEQMLMAARLYPQGSSEYKILMGQALKNSGIEPFKGGERPNAPLLEYDASSGQYKVQNPPGYNQAVAGRAAAEASGKAQFEPQTIVDPGTGTPFVTNRATALAPGAPPVQTGLSPYAHSLAEAGGKAPFEPQTYFGPQGQEYLGNRSGLPGVGQGPLGPNAMAPPQAASPQTAIPPIPTPPTPPAATPKQSPEAAPPTFIANTPTGQKDISQVNIDDMFPNGAGIPQRAAPPPGMSYGPPNEMQKEVQKDDAERLEGYNKEQAANQKINVDLLHLREVLNAGFSTSHATQIGSAYANIAHGLGADWAYPRGWAPANAAEFDKASTDLVFAALKALPGQPRVSEISGLQKANPSLVIPRETNYNMMNDILATGKWQDERARLATEYTSKHPGAPLSTFDSIYNRMSSLPDVVNEYKGMMRQNGAVFPEDTPAGGAVPPRAPQASAPIPPALPKGATDSRTIAGKTWYNFGTPDAPHWMRPQ